MAEEIDPAVAFQGAGQAAGIEYWRIEKFEPVRQEDKKLGNFFSGDAYILLSSKKKKGSNKLDYDIHFWLGKHCAADESGTAAIRTVELDGYLAGGGAKQHREVQGHESKLFLSYFKKGIKYLEGGVESGFKNIDDIVFETRLFQCKGKRSVRVEQVPCMCGSLNQGDVFLLETKTHIYMWVGPKSDKMERIKAIEVARRMRDDEKAGRAHIVIIEEDWDTNEEFFKALGSRDKTIKAADTADDDDIVRKLDQDLVLYKVGDADGSFDIEECGSKPLSRKVLESQNCYVLDSGYSGIFVWTGRQCSIDFKKRVWKGVNEFISTRGYPNWISVTRVVDGGEAPTFKQYFPDWLEMDAILSPGDFEQGGNVAKQDDTEYDASEMHGKAPKAEDHMPDDGSGEKKVYRIENFELKEVPEEAHGIFFGGDCYVVSYKYLQGTKEHYIIYFWQGLKCSIDERGASALQAMKLDEELGGEAVQIRVVMNKEPRHFLKIFNGSLLIFSGGHVSGFRSVHDHETFDSNETVMFHIRGQDKDTTRAIQVEARGNSLNSNDVFIMESPRQKKAYVWVGKNSLSQEHEMAKLMCEVAAPDLSGDPIVIEEGQETLKFWDALGGEEEYFTGPAKKGGVRLPPRLFVCTNRSGRFTAEEIVDFDQEDLDVTACNILDTFDEVFVWIGEEANAVEKKESLKTAYNYLDTDPTQRNPDNTIIVVVRQGFEPPQFTGHFHLWDTNKWSEGKTFAEIIAEVGDENAGIGLLEDEVKKYDANYPLEVLQRQHPPEGVDASSKEMYLTDDDFKSVFSMSKEEYMKVAEWKRINMKKDAGLF